ncbi:MAG TPA: glutamyl-tRNA reductase [Microlunatus sp.]|nr:glutamyl-tRNA reductase [Microlunatus sp.]
MSILVLSVSHKTASVDFLAQLTMDAAAAAKFADDLITSEHVDETVVLSTCNRTELYASVSRFHGGLEDTAGALARFAGLSVTELQNRCAVYFDEGAVAHTFGVAAGLDSLVVGESQILGQVRSALTQSQGHGTVGSVLNSLFQQAIRVGKRVHTETSVGSAGRSLVTAAYDLLGSRLGPLQGSRVVVVGAGSMATLAARTASASGAAVTCVNRTFARAERLASLIDARARTWSELPAALHEADIVVTCTGARDLLITSEELAGTPVRGVVDLALPSDVSPDVTRLGVELVNLARLVEDQIDSATAQQIEAARQLVRSEVADFLGMRRAATVAPTVVALRSMASEVVAGEMQRLDLRLPDLTEREREEVHKAVRRVVDKLLHAPTVRVQELAADSASVDYAAALRELFALDPQTVAAVMSPEVPRS